MALVNKVDQRVKSTLEKVIEFQLITYCFFNDIKVSSADLKCLVELSKISEIELTEFCVKLTDLGIFKSPQSARNAISKASKKNLITKIGKNKKKISINSDINIQSSGIVLLDYKILGIES